MPERHDGQSTLTTELYNVMDPAVAAKEFSHVSNTLVHVIRGVKFQRKRYGELMGHIWGKWDPVRVVPPLIGFAATISIALSQFGQIGRAQPFFAVLAILASASGTAFSSWLATKRFHEEYALYLANWTALGRLADKMEYTMRRALEEGQPEQITPRIVDDWHDELDRIMNEAATNFEKTLRPHESKS
jgi:hypothetical protein